MTATAIDLELSDHPAELRWRIWMGRVEAVIFASPKPVATRVLSAVVGKECDLDHLIHDIRAELTHRPYELVEVAGGWHHRTRPEFAGAIRLSGILGPPQPDLSQHDLTILMAIAYFQPATRADLAAILGKRINRDVIATLSRKKLIAPGPRSPVPGAPYTYVTTHSFLAEFGFRSLADLPDMEKLSEEGLLTRGRFGDYSCP